MMRARLLLTCVAAAALFAASPLAQTKPAAATSPRIYVFDNGKLSGLDPKQFFGFERSELKAVDFTSQSYLIVHPRGTLMWDTGVIPDSAFTGDGRPVTEGISTADKPLLPQLAAAGYTPSDISYLAMSHYHSDHTANANAFAGSTWIVQKADRDAMFAATAPPITAPATFSALKNAKTKVLNNEDFDVFGDGSVVILSTPGHTPGHQVLFVKTAKRGPIVLAGDLYHYPEERTTGRTPSFEFNAEQSKASRAKIEAFLTQQHAQIWIEHDIATHQDLPKSPAFVD
jgi:glyoxylase-like metal-dependent hydrolase (beta-lactamase superfamily II)